ncbi:MAG TPA: glycosyltransferase family 2 protein [Acidimicrobiales bacterium]|nr:glycosyltransferase family 2 protein [Acidimicrobiales bacterium]
MSEDHAPPVVAVVVACDPGPWLEECLSALAGQDYPQLSVLVVDAGSEQPIAPRIAAVAPDVYLRRLAENAGFGPSANVVLDAVSGASFYLFCHDDVVADGDAVRRMVEEAFRSNAGIVAPKLVGYEEPDRLLQLGLGVDRFGAPVRRVARREFDQSQHDEAREVFGAPGAFTLVRADLFAALGGFDPHITMFGEDVDLSWRARIAGARVVVAPSARVRHCEAAASRQRPLPEARALQWRHELRAVLKNYGRSRRAIVVAQLAVLSLLEVVYFGAIGKRWRVQQVVGAWRWNLAAERDLGRARAAVAESRRIPDRVVAKLFTRRSLRVTRFVRPMLEDVALHWSRPRRDMEASLGEPAAARARELRASDALRRRVALVIAAVVVVLFFGSRSLLVGHLPLVGQYLPLPSPWTLIGHYLGGWTDGGMQGPGPASPAFAMLGVAGVVMLGAMGLTLKVLLVGAVVAGAIGVARLLAPFGSLQARVAGAVAYLFVPLAWNDLGRADVQGVAAYAAMPFVLGRLARATGLEPFAAGARGGSPEPATRARATGGIVPEALGLGVVLAVAGSFVPALVLVAIAAALALLVATALFDRPAAGVRALLVTLGASGVAFALAFPWSLTFFQPGARWSVVSGALPAASATPDLASLLRLTLGPIGGGPLGWALLAASGYVLLVGRGARFAWGARLWVVALGTAALAWAAGEGWLGSGGGAARVLVAPLAVCVAALVGLGFATVGQDLRRSGFGWRHAAAVLFGAACALGVLPVLGSTPGGRFELASTGYDTVLSWVGAPGTAATKERILWLGDPRALPLVGWQVERGLAAGVSNAGLPDARRLLPASDPGAASAILADVRAAQSGLTIRLGHLVAPDGIRYVVVPSAIAPVLPGVQSATRARAPQVLLDALSAQSDLHELPSEGGIVVFENSAWSARSARALAGSGGTPALLRSAGVAGALLGWWALALYFARRRRATRGRRRELHRVGHGAHRAHAHPTEVGPAAPPPAAPPPAGAPERDGDVTGAALDPAGAPT